MASNELPPDASQYYLSTGTASHHNRDFLNRKRAASCSSISSGGTAGAEYGHAAVYYPSSPRSLAQVSHMLTWSSTQRSFEQNGFIRHQDNVGYGSNAGYGTMGGQGITQDGPSGFASPVSSTPGTSSALGIEVTGSSPVGIFRFPKAPTPLSLADDLFPPSEPLLGSVPGGPTLTITQPATVDPTSSKNFESNSGFPNYFMSQSQCASPSSPNWPASQMGPTDFSLLFPRHGSRTPSSRSTGSSPLASPLSGFSALSINSPSTSIGEVDDDGPSRAYLHPEGQAQEEPQWGTDGWVPSSPPCLDNGTESFSSPFLGVLPTALPSTVTDMRTLPTAAGLGGSPGPSRHSQAFPSDNSYPLMDEHPRVGGIEAFSGDSQPDPSCQSFPSTLSTSSESLRSGVLGSPNVLYIHSGPSAPSGMAGTPFSLRVNESFGAIPFDYEASTLPIIGANSLPNTPTGASGHDIYPNRHSGVSDASMRKKGAWCHEPLRAKKITRQYNNHLLHMSIAALEQNGRILKMPSLRDTVRFIIGNCFSNSPTRQDIVDFLFEALPQRTQMEVVEVEVKKYYKDRVGHILSAPASKGMFVSLSGTGRWALGEGF